VDVSLDWLSACFIAQSLCRTNAWNPTASSGRNPVRLFGSRVVGERAGVNVKVPRQPLIFVPEPLNAEHPGADELIITTGLATKNRAGGVNGVCRRAVGCDLDRLVGKKSRFDPIIGCRKSWPLRNMWAKS
jgi:hypothetical protein